MTDSSQAVRTEVIQALKFAQSRQYEKAEQLLHEGIASGSDNPEEMAVLYSTLGMILRKQGKMDAAWKAYQKAESSLPEDPILKIILARFLLDELGKHDQAIKKGKEILKQAEDIPTLRHQAHSIMGLGYLRKGNRKKALDLLDKAMANNFEGVSNADNIDFNLIEALIRENIEVKKCHDYIQAAYNLARANRQYKTMTTFRNILDSFETTNV